MEHRKPESPEEMRRIVRAFLEDEAPSIRRHIRVVSYLRVLLVFTLFILVLEAAKGQASGQWVLAASFVLYAIFEFAGSAAQNYLIERRVAERESGQEEA